MANRRQLLGRWGEDLAAEYLIERGYTILERNVRTRYGEIDLVAQLAEESISLSDSPVTVFVEVKIRSTRSFGLPEEIRHCTQARAYDSGSAIVSTGTFRAWRCLADRCDRYPTVAAWQIAFHSSF